jgi:hypothetical protein
MDEAWKIDYAAGLQRIAHESYADIVAILRDELPDAWHARYQRMCARATNVLAMTVHGFDYLFDYTSELVASGALPPDADAEDRLVVAFGVSQPAGEKRGASRIRGFPGSNARGDRGHFAAHASGGGTDINLFHQAARLNRGWSAEGKVYRELERYCAQHAGTFFFSRPIYTDATARPAFIEFGRCCGSGPSAWSGSRTREAADARKPAHPHPRSAFYGSGGA